MNEDAKLRRSSTRMMREPNPILAAIELSLKGQRCTAIMDGWHTLPRWQQLDIIRQFFDSETIYEVGALVLGAVLADDKQLIKIVRDAIKAGHHLFNRDRELVLLKPALRYMLCNWDVIMLKNGGDSRRSVEELKKGVEQHCNKGEELPQYRWSRLARALGLPKRSCVRHGRKPVKLGEVGEIIDLAPPLAKKRQPLKREPQRHVIVVNKALRRRWAEILLDMDRILASSTSKAEQKAPAKKIKHETA
jgi:hypothetical protein